MPYISANAIRLLEHRHGVAALIQLRTAGETRWTRTDDGYFPSSSIRRRRRNNPTFIKRAIDDGGLDGFDPYRLAGYSEHTRTFTRRGTNSARELGKVVRLVQEFEGRFPISTVDKIVPVRDQVVERTT
jgi:hypothetical protein